MTELSFDQAFEQIVDDLLSRLEPPAAACKKNTSRDLDIYELTSAFWSTHGTYLHREDTEAAARRTRSFYDAAWYLCQIGVLRPGLRAPLGNTSSKYFAANEYSLTSFGEEWLRARGAGVTTPTHPSSWATVISRFGKVFGAGFVQRSTEAVGCYYSAHYLSTCVMVGAAAESVLLAVATAKQGDEQAVIKVYRGSSGRRKLIDCIVGKQAPGIKEPFRLGCEVVSYWRDEAAHGTSSSISEVEAHMALGLLLRFCQTTSDNWSALTRPAEGLA